MQLSDTGIRYDSGLIFNQFHIIRSISLNYMLTPYFRVWGPEKTWC